MLGLKRLHGFLEVTAAQIQDYALWEVIENGDSWVPISQTTEENGITTSKVSTPATAEENVKDSVGYDKYKVECLQCHMLGYLPGSKEQQEARKIGLEIKTTPGSKETNKTLPRQFLPPHPLIYNRPNKLDLSYSGLDEFKELEFKGYGPENSKKESNIVKESDNSKENSNKSLIKDLESQVKSSFVKDYGCNTSKKVSEVEPKKVRENNDAPIIEDWVSDDKEQDESITKPEKKTITPTAAKIEKPFRKSVRARNNLLIKGFVDSGCSRLMTGKFDGKSDEGTSEVNSQECIVMPIWKDPSYFDSPTQNVENGEPKTANDTQKQDEDGLNNENAEQERFSVDSSSKDVNTIGQQVNTASLDLNTGLQVQQKEDGIFISQDKYLAEILKKFNYSDVKYALTPIDFEKPLVKDGDADDVDVHLYRSMIGSFENIIASRPDIMFVVCACARFQVTPKHHIVKRIFRYLKGKPTLGLWYSRDSLFELVVYTDSDYAGATLDRKSTTGGCQFLGNRLISWQCKKKTVVATSTTEAEYVAAASCCGQVVGYRIARSGTPAAATTASS
ncbi:hypothetical protein Tco_1091334 [Tanacetum coccineum]|uniref:Uncharacterized protein n=1 Tax=Tanacetum coccineum TaxID=301880 RepID=A0ABQ5I7W2_9ASTR